MASPEAIAQQAQAVAEETDKSGGAKHFDQPGVRFSLPRLRDEELARKTASGESFRQHVEVGLLLLRATNSLNPAQLGEFTKKIKFNDYDKGAKWKAEDLNTALDQVQSGARSGGGASAAAAAREKALREEIETLKKQLAAQAAGKAKS